MPLPGPGRYRLFLPPFPMGALVVVAASPPTLTMLGATAPYDPVDDVFPFGPTTGVSCQGGTWEATVPDKNGLPVTLKGPCTFLGNP